MNKILRNTLIMFSFVLLVFLGGLILIADNHPIEDTIDILNELLPTNFKFIENCGNSWIKFSLDNDIFLFHGSTINSNWVITKIGELE